MGDGLDSFYQFDDGSSLTVADDGGVSSTPAPDSYFATWNGTVPTIGGTNNSSGTFSSALSGFGDIITKGFGVVSTLQNQRAGLANQQATLEMQRQQQAAQISIAGMNAQTQAALAAGQLGIVRFIASPMGVILIAGAIAFVLAAKKR